MNKNLSGILAVELLCAARGIEFRSPLKTSRPLQDAIGYLRKKVPTLEEDRYMAHDIEVATSMISNGGLVHTTDEINLEYL